jgi:hypothetical protein
MLSWLLVKYVLTAALRDRLVLVLFIMVLVGAALSVFLGSSAVTESDRFALVFAAAGLRFAGVAGLVLFIVSYIRRAFESRDVDFLLSRPLSRVAFLCSHAAAFSLLALFVAVLVTISVFAIAPHHVAAATGAWNINPGAAADPQYAQRGIGLWGLSLAAEFIIMANAALFFAMVLPGATAGSMASFGLYVLARLMGELLGIVNTGAYSSGYHLLAAIMNVISLIVPRLDLMAQSSWLVYGAGGSAIGLGFIIAQCVIYSALLVLAAIIDLVRRQF